jgi:hypothetical protein
MKQLFFFFLVVFAISCNNQKTQTPTTNFSFTVDTLSGFENLPALQSFAFASANNGQQWLLLGGRTNGFHGFDTSKGQDANFPFKKANEFIYVFDTASKHLDSMNVRNLLSLPLIYQFTSTNAAVRQVDSFLYVCGGYGTVIDTGKTGIVPLSPEQWITHNRISRIHVPNMVKAIQTHNANLLRQSVVSDTSSFVTSTGGELYKLTDGNFYLAFGHNFTGKYSSNNASQIYLDAVNVFSLEETDKSIKIIPVTKITDGLSDTVTQFRRRDLNVVPSVINNGTEFGITAYAGVFTYGGPQSPFNSGGNPFTYPIYINGNSGNVKAGYTLDTSFKQISNVYSAPNLSMYSNSQNSLFTTIFGGLGDTLQINNDNAAFTTKIGIIQRNNNGQSSFSYNTDSLPSFVGAEGVFVQSPKLTQYNNNTLGILDFDKLPTGKTLVGYIYGGILSNAPQWNYPGNNPTLASSKVYRVWIQKN